MTDVAKLEDKRIVKSGADRRPRGWLETDVKSITDQFVTGVISLGEGEFLTPHRVSKLIQKLDSLDEAPSTGAVQAVFQRWIDAGFMVANEKPFAFMDYTEEGRTYGLTALKAKRRAEKAEVRKADPSAKKPGRPRKKPDLTGTGYGPDEGADNPDSSS